MSTIQPQTLSRSDYEEAAEAYLRSLPPEHFMEATPQATQRKITLESFDVVHVHRPEVQTFNELLLQYLVAGQAHLGQVVSDNMVVVHDEPIEALGSYDLAWQPVGPFWVMEYVSKSSKRKDYEVSFHKYEHELKVPYFLLFYPEAQELTLYRHDGSKYVAVPPNEHGRCPIPELDMEVALLDGWARYWYEGALVPLPAELLRATQEANRRANEERQRREQAERGREQAERGREQAERGREQAERGREQAERGREQAERLVEEEKHSREQAERRAEEAQQARVVLEQRLAQLQAQLERPPTEQKPNG